MRFRIEPVQWGAGSYCAFNGLLMLVTPHQYLSPGYAAMQPQLWLWGLFFLIGGSFMLSAALLHLSRLATSLAHGLAGACLLSLAACFVSSQLWSGTINLTVLGLGTLIAGLQVSADRAAQGVRSQKSRDLLCLLVGAGMIANGCLMLLAPAQYSAPLYTPIRPFLFWVGFAFVLGGALLLYSQLRPAGRGAGVSAVMPYLFGAATLFSFLPLVVLGQIWSGIPYYGVIAVLVGMTPFTDRVRWGIDNRALRTRMALAMALVAAVPLILMASWFSSQSESGTRVAALQGAQRLATSLASGLMNYADGPRSAMLTLAANPDLLALTLDKQHALLQLSARAYPDIVAFSTFDAAGKPVSRSDNLPPTALSAEILTAIRATRGPVEMVIMSPLLHRPVFIFGAPSTQSDGTVSGFVFVAVESTRISESLTRADSSAGGTVYLVDDIGRVIAHPDSALVASFADLRGTAPVAAFLGSPDGSGALSYGPPATEQLAGYSRVQGSGWGVVVEQPVAIALGAMRMAREQLLVLVLVSLAAAAAAGVLVARSMTAPLSDLVAATAAMAQDGPTPPLPASGIRELDLLAGAFSETRERIAARTAERTQAQVALQTLNTELESLVAKRTAALNQTNVTLEEKATALERSNAELAQFAYVASHDLQEPLRMMASYSQLLARRYHGRIDEKADHYIEYITEGAVRMQQLIEDLLTYARLGSQTTDLEAVSVEDALEQALHNLHLIVSTSGARVSHDSLPDVLGDRLLLTQIFQNLIHNAIKFHGVHKPVVTITARPVDDFWEICVQDNGIGIEAQYQQRIFTIFQRLHSRQEYAGNGIGLAAVKKMVEHNGGMIRVESSPGEGAAFYFTVQMPKEARATI